MNKQSVYTLLNKIPKGKVTTYKALAQALNSKAYRAIGQILKQNPNAPIVPCHRVVQSDGKLGGYALGIKKKIELLKKEGVNIENNKINLNEYEYRFNQFS